jgi:hypothetical protein
MPCRTGTFAYPHAPTTAIPRRIQANRLTTCTRHAIAEILQRPNPARRHRTYPRVTKRASGTKFPRKALDHKNIRHRGPPDIRLTLLQS